MGERLLITKLIRTTEGRADLFGRGHKYKDLTLFDISDLADVGIDFEGLPAGQEVACRFWAHYELSDKLNQAGNPYKNVIALEPKIFFEKMGGVGLENTYVITESGCRNVTPGYEEIRILE